MKPRCRRGIKVTQALEIQHPSHELVPSFIRMRDAHMAAGENEWTYRDEEIAQVEPPAYVDLMGERARGRNVAEGFVRADEFWIVEAGEVVGSLGVRHELNERLRLISGHIGYSTHPAYRSRSIATFALKKRLEVLAGLGVAEALVTCSPENLASIRVIEKCGGRRITDTVFPERPDLARRRYLLPTNAEREDPALNDA